MRCRPVVIAAAWILAACETSPTPPRPLASDPAPPVADRERRSAVDAIEAWNAELSDADRRAKYCKMARSPFVFFRGTNHLFWSDGFGDPRLAPLSTPDTRVWLQGDLHVANYGAYDNDEGVVVYSLNDFDETIVGDYQYDLWRLATSVVLVARQNGDLSESETAGVLDRLVGAYLAAMTAHAADDSEDQRVFDASALEDPLRSFVESVEAKNSRVEALDDWTLEVDGARVFDLDLADLEAVDAGTDAEIRAAMASYGDSLSGGIDYDPDVFAVKGVARRLNAGTGSLGTPRYYVLIEGETSDNDDDHILDVKRQGAPTAYRFASPEVRARYDQLFTDHAVRHAIGYKALEIDTDDFLGVMALSDGSYSVRERSVFKKSFKLEQLADLDAYGRTADAWGAILAAAHARSDEDFDPVIIPVSVDRAISELTAGREDELADRIAGLAVDYADRVERDWADFVDALAPSDCPE